MDARRLDTLPLFAGLTRRELQDLAVWMDEVDVPAGKTLLGEGSVAHEFVIIETGTASVTIEGRRVNDLADGDFFGEIALVEAPRRTATVTATSPMRAIVMTGGNFRAMMREKPEVADKLRHAIDERRHRTS